MKDLLAVQVLLTRAWSVTCTGGPWCCCHCQGFAWEPIPALPGALWTWKPWVRMAHLRGGQIPVLFILPRADLGGFCPIQEDSSHRAAHPKVCFLVSGQFSLWKCQASCGRTEQGLSLAASPDKSRGGLCWCPLSSCALTTAPQSRAGLTYLLISL